MLEANVLEDAGLAHFAAIVARPADQGEAHVGYHAGDIQHDGFLSGVEGLKEFLDDDGCAQNINFKAGPPVLQVLLDKGVFVREVAGVVDEDIWGTNGFENGGDGSVVGDVGGVGFEGDSGKFLGEGVLGFLGAGFVAAQDANARNTRGSETAGDVRTNTTTGAGDKGTFAGERAAWKGGGEGRVRLPMIGDK